MTVTPTRFIKQLSMPARRPAFELVRPMLPKLEGFAITLGLSEIVGHRDTRESEGYSQPIPNCRSKERSP